MKDKVLILKVTEEGRKPKVPKKLNILYQFPPDLNYLPSSIHKKRL